MCVVNVSTNGYCIEVPPTSVVEEVFDSFFTATETLSVPSAVVLVDVLNKSIIVEKRLC